jgi:UDP-glucose 4-epimerase
MLECMTENNIRNVVFSSTAAVYGNPADGVCLEDSPALPINPYGETKLASEKMIRWVAERYKMNYCIFRYFNVAGADRSLEIGLNKDHITHLIPVVIQTALGIRDKMTVFGNDFATKDGTGIRDYIHVSDLAYAHVLGAKYIMTHHKSELFNLGSHNGYSVLEIIQEVDKRLRVHYEIGERRAGDPAKIVASNHKAQQLLNWQPSKSLHDIIESDLAYRKKLLQENQP